MEKTCFNLQAHLQRVYATFPEATRKPIIGITANYENIDATLRSVYYRQVVEVGGVPLIIPPVADVSVIVNTLQHIDALLLTGGADYNPLWAGEQPSPQLGHVNAERDLPELLITRLAYNRQIPMLGICRGIQTLAMALDGKVAQHVDTHIKHSQDADRSEPTHSVTVQEGSILSSLYNSSSLFVNSFHHQAVSQPGPHFVVTATAPDGIIEAIESSEHKPILGVQWHPEWMGADGLPLFQWLVDEARLYARHPLRYPHVLSSGY